MSSAFLLFLLFQGGAENLDQNLQQLLDMVANSTEDINQGSDYVITKISTEGAKDDPILVIRELHYAAGTKKTKMIETQKVRCANITRVRQHAERGSEPRNYSVILTYRQGAGRKGHDRLRSDSSAAFGQMKSLRLGLFSRQRAEEIIGTIEKIRSLLAK